MENYIIYRKIVNLEKAKDHLFSIPSLFNPAKTTLELEISEDSFSGELILELNVHPTQNKDLRKNARVAIPISGPEIRLPLAEVPDFANSEYLLLGCRANKPARLAISLLRTPEK